MPHVVRSLACAVLYPMLTTLVMRAYLYGVTDNNVFRMVLYTVLPALLFFSLDLLFKLVRMYRYGLKILAEKKKEEEELKKKKEE